jgi:hypothetical protein
MDAGGGRPAERYWCRVCNQRGLLKHLDRDTQFWPCNAPNALTPCPSQV